MASYDVSSGVIFPFAETENTEIPDATRLLLISKGIVIVTVPSTSVTVCVPDLMLIWNSFASSIDVVLSTSTREKDQLDPVKPFTEFGSNSTPPLLELMSSDAPAFDNAPIATELTERVVASPPSTSTLIGAQDAL